MSVETDPITDPPTCSVCDVEMRLSGEGTSKTVPLIGSQVEFRQFNCPECGRGVRYERSDPDEAWSRPTR
ncbi:hypothetical protein C477_04894 [Haloterrigena salina JCM 13891]|uniref:Small CPxCG-related zinc finger protein n=1 Tax=Haloterrigena salina JCM 13891 TaxID=1227488 RepID=M0CEF6_9EURY|nr:hypothetical protein [Haloterrigena salina]ELZ21651.1 hypothetical protein C477_04894 [Haloterrigena salina JCM 13891]